MDLHSRRLIGWSIADPARADLVADALKAAVDLRGGQVDGVVFHTDPLNPSSTPLGRSRRCVPR